RHRLALRIGDLHAHRVLADLGRRGAGRQLDPQLRPGGRRRRRARLRAAHGLERALEPALGIEDEIGGAGHALALPETLGDDAAAFQLRAGLDGARLEVALALVDEDVLALPGVHHRVLRHDEARAQVAPEAHVDEGL